MYARVEMHAEVVATIELTLAWRAVMVPVTTSVHVLLDCLLAVEGTRACVTFPHGG